MKNPPAFPRPASDAHQHGMHKSQEGMTLREYFAAKAMQGMMVDVHDPACAYIAKTAYEIADAMMKAREA